MAQSAKVPGSALIEIRKGLLEPTRFELELVRPCIGLQRFAGHMMLLILEASRNCTLWALFLESACKGVSDCVISRAALGQERKGAKSPHQVDMILVSRISDVDNAEKQAKNPPLFGKLFKAGSIEEAALSAYAAKKKLEEQRYELKIFLNMTYGPQAYEDLLKMEGQIRKQRQETIYKQQQLI